MLEKWNRFVYLYILIPQMLAEKNTSAQEVRDEWFSNFVALLSADKFMLDTNTATPELTSFYSTLIEGSADKLAFQGKQISQQHFVSKMLVEYLTILKNEKILPNRLAFDINDSEVLVWAEIENEDSEKKLILAEAKVNAKYHVNGFDMTSLIVEKADLLPIPNHYAEFKYKA